ncbi:hypothetical protein AAG570_013625 [Ranatra chinensis]|uniref:Leucine-rich repeat-containing protein 16A n=1 Tax=Ranatra chinensis TaxID=642074 RepID=A0ABD0YEL5_9HEMI
MSTRSQLTKDLNDSVTSLLGKRIKILLKNVVRLETKGDKTENRVLVFSPCRLFLLTAKVPTRIDCHFHYLEIHGIETKKVNNLGFLIGDKWYTFVCNNGEVETMLHALCAALQVIFPGVPLQQIVDRVAVDGFEQIMNGSSSQAPCGAFSTQYACMCDYHSLPYREEVAWDVDTIYVSHNTRELSLRDFEHLEPKDLVPIISALEHNRWFTSFRAANLKLTHEAVDRILHVVSRSVTLEQLHLHNLSLKHDFVSRLCTAVTGNSNTPLHTLDLSNNLIEDKSVGSLCGILTKLVQGGKGIIHLNLSHCGLTPKGIAQLTQCLTTLRPQTLTYLNLSGNSIKDEINGLCSLLAEPNAIKHLDISNTEAVLDSVFGALLRGCSTSLIHLNVSRNIFSLKKSKEMPPSFKQFFTSTLSLKYLNMSHCKLPMEALKNLLLGLACNESTAGLELDLSCNCLGSHGAHVLESCIHGVRAISSLDISDNGLESELGGVVAAVGRNKSILELNISKNLLGVKPKHLSPVMDAVVHTIQEDDCFLQKLLLADCKLKSELYTVINALGSNQCLRSIDISGNSMGDLGARLLAKALQTNCKLRSIVFDRNNISIQGYTDIAYALNSNYTVVYLGSLLHDVIPCMKLSPERTEQVLSAIHSALYRNSLPGNTRALRRQHGALVNCSQQTLERAISQTQETIKTLAQSSTEHTAAINSATAIIQDAENSKQVFGKLQDIAEGTDIIGTVEERLSSVAQEISHIQQQHHQRTVDEMLASASEMCPTVISERLRAELRVSALSKLLPDQDFLTTCVVTEPSLLISNRVTEVNLTTATHIADRLTDEVIDLLNKTHNSLVGGKRSSTPDVLRTMPRQIADPSHPMATPQLVSRRKSVHGRKLRPNSVVDTYSAEHIPDLLPSISTSPQVPSFSDSLDSVCEGAGQRLQHLVKGRPRRAKTRAPTRPNHNPPTLADSEDMDSTDNQSTASEISTSIKPRPWSALCTDKSEACSEASTAANTPDSADTPSLASAGKQNNSFLRYI